MYQPVTSRFNVIATEDKILRFWNEHRIFKKTLEARIGSAEYVFYEGPPTANGKPGVHHVLARAFKDLFPRYKTMQGYHVVRRGGWDTHGLPVEIEVEKQLNFKNKQQIEAFGIAAFNQLCKASALTYIQDWEKLTERIGYWVDLDTAYVTYKNEYIESVWWILKNFWERGLIYRGNKVVPYCPRCGTALSDHEVALGYKETSDPSVFVRMRLANRPNTSLLVWTTTPWTLPGNVAVAAHPDLEYVTVERVLANGSYERLILAEVLVTAVFGDEVLEIVERFKGDRLAGEVYVPLYTFLTPEQPAYRVVLADFVTTEDGSGLVHLAPAFGAEDMTVAQKENLPTLVTVNDEGRFISEMQQWAGQFVKDADPAILQDLDMRGLLLKAGQIEHTYPFCWRCSTPLLYFARPTWFLRTSAFRDRLLAINQQIGWYPEHIKNGRFGNWLENNIDWALGRNRYWGTPLPVWECEQCHHTLMVGSVAELSAYSGQDLSELNLHRPYVDEVRLACPACQAGHESLPGKMSRVPELIDVWFDSGAMPYAQWHYPFENQATFAEQFPADFICEGIDQTRGWFYALHAIGTLLFDSPAYRNVISLGLILDKDGVKMSKTRGNTVNPWDVIHQHGADAMRWYLYTASPPSQERRFSIGLVGDVITNFTLTLWNTYSFLVTYANLDGWQPGGSEAMSYSLLDRWILSELNVLVRDVTAAYERYDVTGMTRPIQGFVELLSNWYLRRSRRRFWKSQADADKNAAYTTLNQVLVTLAKLLAPAMPFLAEELYQNLVCSVDAQAAETVHLAAWPQEDPAWIDTAINKEMRLVLKLVSLGHSARNKVNCKVRQPLAEAAFAVANSNEALIPEKYADLLKDELNVKSIRLLRAADEAAAYIINPLPRQLGQKYGKHYPAIRAALLAMDPAEVARKLLAGTSVAVSAAGVTFSIEPNEIEVQMKPLLGYAVAAEGATLAALVTELTPALVNEGLAREFMRRVQDLRKTAALEIADRIRVHYQATPRLHEAIAAFRDTVANEVLAVALTAAPPEKGMVTARDAFDGEEVWVGVAGGSNPLQ